MIKNLLHHKIYQFLQESFVELYKKKSPKRSTLVQSQKRQNDLCSLPSNITVIQAYAPTSNAEEAEWVYEDL